MTKPLAAVVITAKNEGDNIGSLVSQIVRMGLPVYVADDGSTDNTMNAANSAGASMVIRHDTSYGIGESLMDLWRFVKDYEFVVQIDAGNSHDPRWIPGMLREAYMASYLKDRGVVIIGSRFIDHGRYIGGSRWRRAGSMAYGAVCRWLMPGCRIWDWTSGYRVFSRGVIERMLSTHFVSNGHAWQTEVLARALEMRVKVVEYPITYVAGSSSMKLKSALEAIKVLVHIFFHVRSPWAMG